MWLTLTWPPPPYKKLTALFLFLAPIFDIITIRNCFPPTTIQGYQSPQCPQKFWVSPEFCGFAVLLQNLHRTSGDISIMLKMTHVVLIAVRHPGWVEACSQTVLLWLRHQVPRSLRLWTEWRGQSRLGGTEEPQTVLWWVLVETTSFLDTDADHATGDLIRTTQEIVVLLRCVMMNR